MKKILKFIIVFLLSCFVGLIIGSFIGGLISGKSFYDIITDVFNMPGIEMIGVPLLAVVAFAFGVILNLVLHEAGHLVFGLMTGYRFLSFRIFNFTFYRKADGKIGIKKFSVDGTGGQCLMLPPKIDIDHLPVVAYNLGGIFINLILAILSGIGLFFCKGHPIVAIICIMVMFSAIFILILNGIPMIVNGMPNDGYNALRLRKNPISRKAFASLLEMSALVQNGTRPRDIPDDLFLNPDEVDFKEALQVNNLIAYASKLMELNQLDEALDINYKIIDKAEKIGVMHFEAKCEAASILLMQGNIDDAKSLLNDKDMKRVKAYARVMSSKQRLLFLIALLVDNDRQKAQEIYDNTITNRNKYLIQGEVEMDIDIMKQYLNK